MTEAPERAEDHTLRGATDRPALLRIRDIIEEMEPLASDYREPTVKITTEEAVAHRLRRIYLPLFAILNAAWVVRVTAFGTASWPQSAAIGMLPGRVVTIAVGISLLGTIVLAFRPRTWHAYAELRTEELRREDGAD